MQDDGAARTALTTKEECREAWRYLRPYAEGVQEDARRLARLQGAPKQVGLGSTMHVSGLNVLLSGALHRFAPECVAPGATLCS